MTVEIADEADARLVAGVKTATLALMLGLIIDLANPSLLAATVAEVDADAAAPATAPVLVTKYFPTRYLAQARANDTVQAQAY